MHFKTIFILCMALALVFVCGCVSKSTTQNPTETTMLTVYSKHVQYVDDHKEFGITFGDEQGHSIVYEEPNANVIYNSVKVNHAYEIVMYNNRIMSIDGVNMN